MGRTVKLVTPAVCQTVGALIDSQTPVTAWCSRCETHSPVDLPALAVAKGRGYSLKRKRAHCPTCGQLVAFHAKPDGRMWRTNLSEAED